MAQALSLPNGTKAIYLDDDSAIISGDWDLEWRMSLSFISFSTDPILCQSYFSLLFFHPLPWVTLSHAQWILVDTSIINFHRSIIVLLLSLNGFLIQKELILVSSLIISFCPKQHHGTWHWYFNFTY